MVQLWHPGTDVTEDPINSVPQWVKLVDLHPNFWSTKAMSRISSVLGRPLFTQLDNLHNAVELILSACVTINPDFSFPNEIRIQPEGANRDIFVKVYSLRMPKCTVCKGFDH